MLLKLEELSSFYANMKFSKGGSFTPSGGKEDLISSLNHHFSYHLTG